MEAPSGFVARLRERFNNRLRIRWSNKEQEWHIEQQVGRAVLPNCPVGEWNDSLIRARDGYHFIMAVTTGDRKRCPKCNYTLHVPVRDTWDIRCEYCALRGRQSRMVAGFWPLDDALLEHLQKIDPLRGGSDELRDQADNRNKLLLAAEENDAMAPGYAYADEHYNRLVGIPQVGYTGKEKSWAA